MTPRRTMHDGQRFGTWTMLIAYPAKSDPRWKHGHAWCRCDCGAERMIFRPALSTGQTKTCRACFTEKSKTSLGRAQNGWVVVLTSSRKGRTFECLTCRRRLKRKMTGDRTPPPCSHCYPEHAPTSRANAARTGISREGIRRRILRGWSVQDATTLPRQSP